jgi:hypothetical protein
MDDVSVEQSVKCLAGATEVLEENLPQCSFVYNKSHTAWPGTLQWKASEYCFFIYVAGVELSALLRPIIGLLYVPWMIDGDDFGAITGINEWQGKPKYSEETCHSAHMLTADNT